MIPRDVYTRDEYADYFTPDHAHNPFHALYAAKRADVLASVRHNLPVGGSVLDLGGGMGRMAVPLARAYKVTLCDISVRMLSLAETAAQESRVPAGNFATRRLNAVEPLPFPSETFDYALTVDLLVHVAEPIATLRELHRVLKPGGQLLADITNCESWWLLRYPRYVGRRPQRWLQTWRGGGVLPEWQHNVRHYRHEQFHSMLDAGGFTIVQEWRYGPRWCPKWFLTRSRRED